ncbi:MAG TPA: FGGY family carbohydrate kinase [Acidimicrobiales bacterium]|nr:FGGY family carbohydrate kinase [Acidimicrobiales bacterium]
MPSVLAIDLGTSGLKVAVVDEAGRVLGSASAPLTTTFLPGGGAEQDAEGWWQAIGECSRRAVASAGADVAAVAVTSQYMSIVAIDGAGRPLAPAVMWMDSRGAPHHRIDPALALTFLERHGLAPLGFGDPMHIAFLREERPAVYAAAAAFVEPVDHLNARLTGRICATQTTAMPLMTVDNRTHGVTDHDPDLVAAAGLDPAKLPPLVPFDEVVGPLTAEAAAHLGLGTDTVVVTGTLDSITSGLGCGVIDSSTAGVIVGTTSVLVTNLDRKDADYDHDLVSVPSPLPGRWFVMAENGVGGRALEVWLGVAGDTHAGAEQLASTVPAGANGVLFLPWLAGSIAPSADSRVRGGFLNMGLATTRADMTRAVYEGVALNAAWLLPHVAALAGASWPSVRLGGGGATSPLWAQVFADALGVRVDRLAHPGTTNARGAALLAHAQLGHISLDDIPGLVEVAGVHEPDESAHATYQGLLAHFIEFHQLVKPLYGALNLRQ